MNELTSAIYLSKSNRCNPMFVMSARKFIQESFPGVELLEFTGGSYNRNVILSADLCFVVSDAMPIVDHDKEIMIIDVGRGIYTEVREFLDKTEGTDLRLFYCDFSKNTDPYDISFTLHPILAAKITDIDNYIRYGKIKAMLEITQANTISV